MKGVLPLIDTTYCCSTDSLSKREEENKKTFCHEQWELSCPCKFSTPPNARVPDLMSHPTWPTQQPDMLPLKMPPRIKNSRKNLRFCKPVIMFKDCSTSLNVFFFLFIQLNVGASLCRMMFVHRHLKAAVQFSLTILLNEPTSMVCDITNTL